jgi:putative membrane protein
MRIAVFALPLLLLTVSARAQVPPARQPPLATGGDRHFLDEMIPLNEYEVRLGQLAVMRGSTAEIRDKGKKMSSNHLELGGRLGQMAARLGVKPATELSTAHQAQLNQLAAQTGPAFDRAFLQAVDAVHAEARAILETAAQSGGDPQLKALAKENLAKLSPQASPR